MRPPFPADTVGTMPLLSLSRPSMRLTLLLLSLAACSSSGSDDSLGDEGGSTGEVDPGGTGDDGGSSSEGEGGSTGEPGEEWPPECVDEGTCVGLEVSIALECEVDGAEMTALEVAWYQGGEQGVSTGITAACGDPLRTTSDAAGVYNLRIAATWASETATWACWYDEGGGGTEGPAALGDVYTWESTARLYPGATNDGPPPIGQQGGGCCLLSGTAPDAFAQTPCEEA